MGGSCNFYVGIYFNLLENRYGMLGGGEVREGEYLLLTLALFVIVMFFEPNYQNYSQVQTKKTIRIFCSTCTHHTER